MKVSILCGCCRLALFSVLGSLHDIKPRDLIVSLQSSNHSTVHVQSDELGVELCLRQLFSLLNEECKITLMQLSVFRTTNFSIEAATYICEHSKKSKHEVKIKVAEKTPFYSDTFWKIFGKWAITAPLIRELLFSSSCVSLFKKLPE